MMPRVSDARGFDVVVGFLLAAIGAILVAAPAAITVHTARYEAIPNSRPPTIAELPQTSSGYAYGFAEVLVLVGVAILVLAAMLALSVGRATALLTTVLILGLFLVLADSVARGARAPSYYEGAYGPPTGAGLVIGTIAAFAIAAAAVVALVARPVLRRRRRTDA